jgi:3-dehydroquinate synthase
MREIEVRAEHIYQVALSNNWQERLIELVSSRSRVAIISSEGFPVEVPLNNAFHYSIPDGEAGKNHEVVAKLWSELHRDGFTRSDIVVGIGGGAVTDFSGFVAATYLRGLDWIAIPTTLAGMVDAAVGGKTGINVEAGKNLVGAFHSPIGVIVDQQWLSSLSDRDFAAGLVEILKCGFIVDSSIVGDLAGTNLAAIRENSELTRSLIERAISVKATVVSSDFKESSLREILNYGHTFGHAIEGYSHYRLRHGEAVAIGMVFAAELSASRGLIDSSLVDLHRTTLNGLGLPTSLDSSFTVDSWPQLLQEMRSDKKARGTQIRFVAVTTLGETSRLDDVNEEELRTIYEKVLP